MPDRFEGPKTHSDTTLQGHKKIPSMAAWEKKTSTEA